VLDFLEHYLLGKEAFFTGESNSVIAATRNDVSRYWVQLDYEL
jgi:hypothetical protein